VYPEIKNVQILIALLKAYKINHLVLSPGSRMKQFNHAVENDPFFTCFSVVDERSAAYFALGMSQEINAPVGIVCTSSTATCNYLPGITEAFYQGIPLLVITGDKDPYYLGQMEDQMIDQVNMYQGVVKKSVNLPIVNNEEDFWYCERLINEALLELNHRGYGPVHINIPVPKGSIELVAKELPEVRKIDRITLSEDYNFLKNKLDELKEAKRILVIIGQNTKKIKQNSLKLFFDKYNCIFYAEHMANFQMEGVLNLNIFFHILTSETLNKLVPDIVISFGGNTVSYMKYMLRKKYKQFKHWHISENGEVIDTFKGLTTIFECKPEDFFDYFVKNGDGEIENNKEYYNSWFSRYTQIKIPELSFSNVKIIQFFLQKIPENVLLHLSILNSIRITQFFNLPKNIKVYANIGTDGIDGSMSSFLGQAYATEKLAFLIIGDLSFFYDMNSIRIRHIKNNVRILLINNGGGSEFYLWDRESNLDLHIAAKHNNEAKGWIEQVGFKYISAHSQEEYLSNIDYFVSDESERPIVFEVFTDMKTDANAINLIWDTNRELFNITHSINKKLRPVLQAILGNNGYNFLKNTAKKIIRR
jgi:2-succinyl-5-enolpyruvyl-6-hydroxy-3-cyclohexene-1-carboxylate synthase